MKRISIVSSSIKSIGYDSQSCILEIEFNRGTIYQYRNVPSLHVIRLMFADSVGKYFHQYIEKSYEYEKIGE